MTLYCISSVAGVGIGCQPRPVVVKFERNHGPHLHLELHRCVGGCHANACTATKTESICVKGFMTVTNHTACNCLCKPVPCSKNFRFDWNYCSCVCDERKCRGNQLFDKNSCACSCKATKKCDHGTKWNSDTCECVSKVDA